MEEKCISEEKAKAKEKENAEKTPTDESNEKEEKKKEKKKQTIRFPSFPAIHEMRKLLLEMIFLSPSTLPKRSIVASREQSEAWEQFREAFGVVQRIKSISYMEAERPPLEPIDEESKSEDVLSKGQSPSGSKEVASKSPEKEESKESEKEVGKDDKKGKDEEKDAPKPKEAESPAKEEEKSDIPLPSEGVDKEKGDIAQPAEEEPKEALREEPEVEEEVAPVVEEQKSLEEKEPPSEAPEEVPEAPPKEEESSSKKERKDKGKDEEKGGDAESPDSSSLPSGPLHSSETAPFLDESGSTKLVMKPPKKGAMKPAKSDGAEGDEKSSVDIEEMEGGVPLTREEEEEYMSKLLTYKWEDSFGAVIFTDGDRREELEGNEVIRQQGVATLTAAFEMMYPYAEDKLLFLSHMISTINAKQTGKKGTFPAKATYERLLYALFEWFSLQGDLSTLLLPPETAMKREDELMKPMAIKMYYERNGRKMHFRRKG